MEPGERGRPKLAAILSADVVGYSRLMGEDERATVETLKAYRAIIQRLVELHHGRVVNAPGDALLAEFPSAVEAVQSAVEIHQDLQNRNAELLPDRRMEYRIGVNLGDVIEEADGALYGDGVNVAARLEGLAEAGGVCISGNVFDEVERKLDLGFDSLGEHQVKNIAKPVRVYRVRTDGQPQTRSAKARAVWRRRKRLITAAAAVIVVIVGGMAGWRATQVRQPAVDPVLAIPTGPAIAVLPFTNLSGDPKQDYFADGITEQIITELTRFRNLRVIARNSTFRYKGQAVDVRQVGRELGVRYVLEGSVRRETQRIRVTAQLLDAQHGGHLWAETYERGLTVAGVFGVQDDITQRVVGAVAGAYGAVSRATFEQSKRKPTASLHAYDCVLRAYEYWRVLAEPEHLKARECLERAVRLDPAYAEAWAVLGYLYLEEHFQGFNPRPNSRERALDAARRAIDLDPANQRAHETVALVHFFRGDLDAFFASAERTLTLNPNYEDIVADIGTHMAYSSWTNPPRRDRAIALVRKAMALNPFHPDWYRLPLAWMHWWKGDYDEALREAKRIDMPDYFWTHMLLATVYGALGRKEEAASALANLARLRPDFPGALREEWRKWNTP